LVRGHDSFLEVFLIDLAEVKVEAADGVNVRRYSVNMNE
jgi:hypothetical protein